jgi:hypothetical protein
MTNRTSRDNQRSEAVVVDAVALGTGRGWWGGAQFAIVRLQF